MHPMPINDWIKNFNDPNHPLIVAGPCSAETEEQLLTTAKQLQAIEKNINVFRCGIWKPRTRPNNFEGVGEVGLKWLKTVKEETNMLTTTEVANAEHVELALKHGVDILWIGARTTVSPFAVQEIADALRGVEIPVMVKNPINADLALWMGALERFSNVGLNKLIAIHRGFSSYEKTKFRNPPNWKVPIELKRRCPDLPIICDPSHIAGTRSLIEEVSQKAMDVDFNGLMIETHYDPSVALSDASQQVTPETLNQILTNIALRTKSANSDEFDQRLEELRAKINRVDTEIIESLAQRMEVANQIGHAKLKCNVQPLQLDRMNELMKNRVKSGTDLGLSEKFVKDLYETIHTESIKIQTDLMKESKS